MSINDPRAQLPGAVSDDLIERLHAQRPEDKQAWWRASEGRYVIPLMLEAAAELEAARKRIAELQKLLDDAETVIVRQREDRKKQAARAERAEQRVARLEEELQHQMYANGVEFERAERAGADLAAVRASLKTIANMPREDNEWDAVDKYEKCQAVARAAIDAVRSKDSEQVGAGTGS